MNTHESYVSLETAKLLKEAGFDWECNRFYDCTNSDCIRYEEYSAPTLEVAQKWFREVKDIYVNAHPIYELEDGAWITKWNIYYCELTFESNELPYDEELTSIYFSTYESALEACIKKCLTLILNKNE